MKKVPGRWVEPLTPVQKSLLWKACRPDKVMHPWHSTSLDRLPSAWGRGAWASVLGFRLFFCRS